ncbi:MAG: NADH-quinone oxidoreductase subunit N [Chitinophagales bacterium]|nr:NADH-quinone oxidoreductase subunit N [Chitinophagales bacterium]
MKALVMVSGLGIVAMLGEIFRFKKILLPLVIVGLLATMAVNVLDWDTNTAYFNNMMTYDNFAVVFTSILLLVSVGWFLLAPSFFKTESSMTDHFALVLFALAGGIVLNSFSDLTMLFLGIEIVSIPMYVLAGSKKTDLRSSESAMKYFLMGAFATSLLLMGVTLVYGAAHSFNLSNIVNYINSNSGSLPIIFHTGILLILAGLAFKVSAFPFHFWAPDVYDGAPTVVTALMATLVKVASLAAFYRLFATCFVYADSYWTDVLWIISAFTILIGNLTALYQKDLKRMLAYSSVSHAGYVLFAILALNEFSAPSLMYYSIAYSVATLAAFTVLVILANYAGNTHIESLKGFARNNPLPALTMVVAMLSLAGIPPLAGFFAKYYLFTAALQSQYFILVLLAVLGTIIGVYYYFRAMVTMFQGDGEVPKLSISGTHIALMLLCLIGTLALGIMPGLLMGLL